MVLQTLDRLIKRAHLGELVEDPNDSEQSSVPERAALRPHECSAAAVEERLGEAVITGLASSAHDRSAGKVDDGPDVVGSKDPVERLASLNLGCEFGQQDIPVLAMAVEDHVLTRPLSGAERLDEVTSLPDGDEAYRQVACFEGEADGMSRGAGADINEIDGAPRRSPRLDFAHT